MGFRVGIEVGIWLWRRANARANSPRPARHIIIHMLLQLCVVLRYCVRACTAQAQNALLYGSERHPCSPNTTARNHQCSYNRVLHPTASSEVPHHVIAVSDR
eukprot:COSAG02_NODE_4654_length_5128_cov_15.002585_2_plen_102_part_00